MIADLKSAINATRARAKQTRDHALIADLTETLTVALNQAIATQNAMREDHAEQLKKEIQSVERHVRLMENVL